MLAVGKKYVSGPSGIRRYISFSSRAPIEEMLQRAGVGPNVRGPPVPEGPPMSIPPGATDKGYTFTQLP